MTYFLIRIREGRDFTIGGLISRKNFKPLPEAKKKLDRYS
jgi:hypothetical protein